MSLRMYGQYIIQATSPAEDPVMVGTAWYDTANSVFKICTSVSPYTFANTTITTHNLLSLTHPDTTAATVTRGAIVTGQGASPTWSKLALGAATRYLRSDGIDAAWAAIVDTDLPTTVVLTSGSYADPAWITSLAATKLTGTLADARLSANVPLIAASNIFTGFIQTISANADTNGPRLALTDTSSNAGARNWFLAVATGSTNYGDLGFHVSTTRGGTPAATPVMKVSLAGLLTASGGVNVSAAIGSNLTSAVSLDYSSGGRILTWGSGAGAGNRVGFSVVLVDNAGANALTAMSFDQNGNLTLPNTVSSGNLTVSTGSTSYVTVDRTSAGGGLSVAVRFTTAGTAKGYIGRGVYAVNDTYLSIGDTVGSILNVHDAGGVSIGDATNPGAKNLRVVGNVGIANASGDPIVFTGNINTATGTTLCVNPGSGGLSYLTSSRRFKARIFPVTLDTSRTAPWTVTRSALRAFVALAPCGWDYRGGRDGAFGFISEDLAAVPVRNQYRQSPLVNYDRQRRPESNRDYALIGMQHLVLQDHEARLRALEQAEGR